MANEVYFLNEKIYDLGLEKSLLNKASKLINKVESLNEDYKILIKEIKKYDKPKFLCYGNNSLINIFSSPKEGKRLLFGNKYGIVANLLYKYKDNLDSNLYEYMKIMDKIKILDYIRKGDSSYILEILNKDEIDADILTGIICNKPAILRQIKFEENDEILKEALKRRYDYYFKDETNYYCFDKILEFYKYVIENLVINSKISCLSLSNLIEIIVNAKEEDYQLYLKYSLVVPLFQYMRNNSDWHSNLTLMTKFCENDITWINEVSSDIKIDIIRELLNKDKLDKKNELLIVENIPDDLMNDVDFNNKLIDKLTFYKIKEEYYSIPKRIDNLVYLKKFKNNTFINKDKMLIAKLLLKTPKTFRYIDKNIIDVSLVDYLLDKFNYSYFNDYYSNFYSDIRFNRYCLRARKFFDKKDLGYDLDKNGIVSVISKYISVKKVSSEEEKYVALCPFHDDHDDSLEIYPDQDIFKCLRCRFSGNARSFVRMFNHKEEKDYYYYGDDCLITNELGIFKKNRFYYYLYTNLPDNLKNDIEIIKKFLKIDGCILKLVPKELRYNEELVEIAMNQDISAFRYIINNEEYKKKYLEKYLILNYYLPNKEQSEVYLEKNKRILEVRKIARFEENSFATDPFESFSNDISIFDDGEDLPF